MKRLFLLLEAQHRMPFFCSEFFAGCVDKERNSDGIFDGETQTEQDSLPEKGDVEY